MTTFNSARALGVALFVLSLTTPLSSAFAAASDYEFQLVQTDIKKGDALIAVRLINKKTGKPVPGAVIFATRLDMAPEGMQEMATKVTPMPAAEPGTYRFKANLSMAGGWQLSLGAKVQGEADTVESRLVLKAIP
ncbi:MAG: FixH family protein [Pseudomonadota bacterium]